MPNADDITEMLSAGRRPDVTDVAVLLKAYVQPSSHPGYVEYVKPTGVVIGYTKHPVKP